MNTEQTQEQNPSKIYALFYSFFLIPFMLAIFGALFFFMFQFLTYEKNTSADLLDNIQSGSATKRWQSAFELSNMLDESKIENKIFFVTSNYVVFSTEQANGKTNLFSTGKYISEIIFKEKSPYFKKLDVLIDTFSIPRQMPIPL